MTNLFTFNGLEGQKGTISRVCLGFASVLSRLSFGFLSVKSWRICALLFCLLFIGVEQMWGAPVTIASWTGAARTANSQVSPTSSQTDNSSARLMSECTLNTAGTGGSAGAYYGTWTNGKCIYITGLNLTGYTGISLSINLRRRNATCTAAFYVSTDGSSYAKDAIDTKTLTNTSTNYEVSSIASNVQAIKIVIDGGSGNLWLGTASITGTAAASCDKKVTIVKGTPETGGSFNLDKTGAQDCCSALTVTVSNITAPSGKEFDAITQSGIATGVTINQSAKTVTYAANSTGTSTINVTFRDLPKYTVTLMDDGDTRTQASYGASVTLPSRAGCTGYTFAGWTKTWTEEQDEWTTTAPTIIPAGSYTPSANENLYPVYTKTEGGEEEETEIFATTSLGSTNTVTTGYAVSAAAEAKSGYYQDGSGTTRSVSVRKSSTATAMISSIPTIATVTATLGGGTTKDPLTNNVYAVWLDASGNELGDAVQITSKITNTTGSDFTANLPVANATSAYGVRIKHQKETSYNVRYYAISLSITTGGSTTYYISVPNCCTNLGSINGSVSWSNAATAVVSWDNLDHVSSWTVKYKTHAAGAYTTWAGAQSTAAGRRSVTITGLTPCTDYDFQIIANPASGYCDKDQTIEDSQTHNWTVSSTISNVTASPAIPATTCSGFSTTITPSGGYELPNTITVTNADHTWNSSTGELTVSNVTGNVAITITGTVAAYFSNGATVFVQAESSSAWDASACVKAWFNASGAGGAAQTTYWLFDATDGDAGKKLYATIVPASGDLNQVTLQRFTSNCSDFWNNNGTLTKASDGGSNTFRSTGSGTSNVAWNGSGMTLDLKGDPNSWGSSLGTFADQGNGVWTATYSNYAPADAAGESQEFKISTNYNGWIGNTGSNNNATLDGMHVGSTYNITATLDVKDHSLTMSKTFVKGTVHFDLQGHGSAISDLTNVAAGSKISAPSPAPTDAAYDFGGWYKEPACTNAWNFASDVVNETMTLYAKWTPHNFTITYEGLAGASNTNPTSYTIETATIVLANPGSRTGYTFTGWTLGGSPITQIVLGTTGDKTITATWSINTPNLAVSAADHVVITATPASESAIAEGANRNVNYNKTVTLNCTPDEHWNLVWDVYKTGESSTKVALSGSGDGATFMMPDYAVTVSAVMTEAAYKTVCFKNNGEDIDGYASVKVYVGESPVAPTLTDGTSGDACDPTSDKHYGWTKETWTSTIATQSEIDARTGTEAVYEKSAALPVVGAGDPATITYHAVWAAGSGSPAINSTLIAKWDKQALTASTAVKAKDKDGNTLNDVTMTSSFNLATEGTYCYQNTITSTVTITISGLDFSAYDKGALSFYARGSQTRTIDVDYSTGGAYSDLVTTPKITKKEQAYEISNIPKATTSIKLTYVYGTSGETFYFGTVRAYGVNNTPSYEFTELTDDNTSGWTGSDWDGYYIITGNSSTKALRSSGICGFSDFATVSAVDSKITTSDVGLIFKVNYSSENSGYVVQGLGGGDYMATSAANGDAFTTMTTSVAYLYGMSYNSLAHTSSTYLKWSNDRFGIYSSSTGVNPTLYKILGAAENFLTTCCTKYDISGASTSGTAVTGGTLTSTDNSACEDREVKITANVSDGYRFDSWTITAGGSPVARKDGSAEIEDGNPIYVFDMPAADVTVSAAFTRVYTVTYDANGGTGEMIDVNSPYAAGDKVTVLTNTFTKAGYNFDSWNYSPAVSVTDGKFNMPSSDVTITAQWTAKPLNNIILAQTEAEIYDQQYVQIDVTYDPSDIVTKGYTLTGPALTKVVTTGSTQTQLKISATKAGVVISEVVSETVSIKANADETKTASVVVTIKPLPRVHFTDIIHNVVFGDVVEEIVGNVLSGAKTTPTHSDVSDPGASYNTCERQHLHLLGWIESTWADAHPGATSGEITGAGSGIYYEAGASINVEVQNGKTFYAVWTKIE